MTQRNSTIGLFTHLDGGAQVALPVAALGDYDDGVIRCAHSPTYPLAAQANETAA
jgi:hypothetical protein